MLLDNPRALVEHHDAVTREVRFNDRLLAFARYWGFRPRACAPYRARTKGKDERGVGYVKPNAIAGHVFASWAALEAHLAWWMREIADLRAHGTTGEQPIERFRRTEARALRPLDHVRGLEPKTCEGLLTSVRRILLWLNDHLPDQPPAALFRASTCSVSCNTSSCGWRTCHQGFHAKTFSAPSMRWT